MKTGAQLYTIKSYTQNVKDFACSMKKIAEMEAARKALEILK